ncbi:ATP-dependent zinc metalloprotease FtsH [Rhodoplanes serenus]|uniref:ATP-dependent zinc metalloprotease FtsH n=2 Tax=Nitrobacteraceae TaxID=41294 RepID=A0A447CYF9_9BRAD|nr:ATP-dependent zinc metalloprotease FtsH [Rhodoplanes serenus]
MTEPTHRPRSTLRERLGIIEPILDLDEEVQADEPPSPVAPSARRSRPFAGWPIRAIAAAAFDAATTPAVRNALWRRRTLAVVIKVPTRRWIEPIGRHAEALVRSPNVLFAPAGDRRSDRTAGDSPVAEALGSGTSAIGVSHAPDRLLPPTLLAAADLHIRIDAPDGAVIRDAIRRCLSGRLPATLEDTIAAGLDLDDIVSAFRPDGTAADAIARLRAASRARILPDGDDGLPRLETAAGFGEAREWGLSLARDIADGRISGRYDHCDRGAVLHGPPGTGKSLLARMIARACGVPLLAASVAEFFASSAGYLDSVVKAQRDLFARAAALAPCIVFLDELDAMPNRQTLSPRGRDWWTPVITDLLLLLDSAVSQRDRIFVIGATNRLADIDAAFLRPGRLERALHVGPPDAEGLAGILRHHLSEDLPDVDLLPVARLRPGAVGADAMEWVRAARRRARMSGRSLVLDDLTAIATPPDLRSPETIARAAVHEAAHAVAATVLKTGTLRHATIVAADTSGGHTRLDQIEVSTMTADRIEALIVMVLSGRAGEEILAGSIAAGAAADLAMATRLATARHASLGLGGTLAALAPMEEVGLLLTTDPKLRAAVEADLQRLYAVAQTLVRTHRTGIEAVAEALRTRRVLTGAEIEDVVRNCFPTESKGLDRAEWAGSQIS